jgi:hypothetical protein
VPKNGLESASRRLPKFTPFPRARGYELDLQYYLDNVKLRGRIYNPVSGDNTVGVGIAYAFQ